MLRYLVFDLTSRIVWLLGFPYAAFWSLGVLVPHIRIQYTLTTLIAFWVLFVVVRWMSQNIRHGDWSDIFSWQ